MSIEIVYGNKKLIGYLGHKLKWSIDNVCMDIIKCYLKIFEAAIPGTFGQRPYFSERTRNPIDDLPFLEYHIGNDDYLRETLEPTVILRDKTLDSSPCINNSISGNFFQTLQNFIEANRSLYFPNFYSAFK